jgi:hypothetical protein
MKILVILVLLYLSIYFGYPYIINNLNLKEYELYDILYLTFYILVNLFILNIIANIFRKNKDSFLTIITKNITNSFLILSFLFLLINFFNYYLNLIDEDYLKVFFIISPIILKSFMLALLQDY